MRSADATDLSYDETNLERSTDSILMVSFTASTPTAHGPSQSFRRRAFGLVILEGCLLRPFVEASEDWHYNSLMERGDIGASSDSDFVDTPHSLNLNAIETATAIDAASIPALGLCLCLFSLQ
jgi:hypothetical protein